MTTPTDEWTENAVFEPETTILELLLTEDSTHVNVGTFVVDLLNLIWHGVVIFGDWTLCTSTKEFRRFCQLFL